MKFTTPLALAAATLVAAPAFAETKTETETVVAMEEKVFTQDSVAAMQGDIVIEAPYAVSMKKDEILVFMTIHNGAKADDTITSVSSDAAKKARFATVKGRGAKRKVEILEELQTPGNNAVMMELDGYHLVLTDIKETVKSGDVIPVTLTFAETGDLKLEVSVTVLN